MISLPSASRWPSAIGYSSLIFVSNSSPDISGNFVRRNTISTALHMAYSAALTALFCKTTVTVVCRRAKISAAFCKAARFASTTMIVAAVPSVVQSCAFIVPTQPLQKRYKSRIETQKKQKIRSFFKNLGFFLSVHVFRCLMYSENQVRRCESPPSCRQADNRFDRR